MKNEIANSIIHSIKTVIIRRFRESMLTCQSTIVMLKVFLTGKSKHDLSAKWMNGGNHYKQAVRF